ncbi:MAG: valine--tRNA ligase, partial [Planctomycetota bacterium]|nr:valine--tRNA ligase [Planctomycetota bacterium]
MAKPKSKTYNPAETEKRIFDFWRKGGYFHPEPDERGRDRRFCMVIPPPNVTGALHLGHALNNTLQDILIRQKRMAGNNTFWLLGTDHAGIATQATVEKTIRKEEGKSRHDLGRDELVRRIWEWKERFGGRIVEQLKLMGCSCDYERERFTLDEGCAKAVRHTFFKLFRDGLIYRGKRLVNWDTQLQTAVADDEVYHETVKGHFYHFKYPVIDPRPGEPEFVHIATTRPETMLADTAVAVHPEPEKALARVETELKKKLADASEKDKPGVQTALQDIAERRKSLLSILLKLRDMARDGRMIRLPLTDREVPLLCDEWAKPELGSGCVKITPAHDPNDYEVGQRHSLPMVNVMSEDGKIARIVESDGTVNANSEKYEGLRFATKGREKVVADLEALGLVEKIEDRSTEVGHSDRSKTAIEPFLSDQWFVKMGDLEPEHAAKVEGLQHSARGLAQMAISAVKRGDFGFHPPRYEKTYLDWLSEKRDWCISRQLWWGHRIPVWSKTLHSQPSAETEELLEDSVSTTMDWTQKRIKPQLAPFVQAQAFLNKLDQSTSVYLCVGPGHEEFEKKLERDGWVQDPDVLDTWFSSALWPHSTLGWPDADPDADDTILGYFYPTSVLSTAREIITLWVARMVITGLYNIGKIPFSDVFIHPVIQDGQGRKMSKSLGNGVDPVDIIDEYGADALRFTLADLATETQDIRMPVQKKKLPDGRTINISPKFEKGRNFCNKLWQAATGFVMANLDGYDPQPLDPATLPLEDRWILSRMTACQQDLDRALGSYRFNEAINALYRFMWDDYCSWYIEMSKPRLAGDDRSRTQQVLVFSLDRLLRMLHPFVPFVTEALWELLGESAENRGLRNITQAEPALVAAQWPQAEDALIDPAVEAEMQTLHDTIRSIREIRTTVNERRGREKK